MLLILSVLMIGCFIGLLMSKKLSALTALIIIPTIFALLSGQGAEMGAMVIKGLRTVAPTGVMLIFAMLYFMSVTDAGMFDPIIKRIVSAVDGDPVKIFIGTALLGFIVALDGDGATVYMIVLAAFMPIYERVGLSRLSVACLLLQCTGLGNMFPWGGPTARAATAVHADVATLFVPMLLPLLACVVWTFVMAWLLGRRERTRIGFHRGHSATLSGLQFEEKPCVAWRFWFNWALTIALMTLLVLDVVPMAYLFMLATAIMFVVNYPQLSQQQEQIARHAPAILAVAGLIFAAAVFTGIFSETGMADSLATAIVNVIPPALGPYLAVITALISIPVTWMVSNDVFYFGMLPVLVQAAGHYGIAPIEMARAALVGQPVHILSPLVASTYLLIGMLKLDYAQAQRFTLRWSFITCLVLLLVALITGCFPFYRDA
ncbi:CitMHS family transporter [Pantoea phytobeneficialis]|uniref:Citrate transporter n=1 Tax=Pantoea phytobeneficialis TaxID=2052056 RepID=A0AAP9KRL2_9GAMM|nr:citrate:proton symporter [Pantoea phytobeneficialis]MDO6406691.1 citrate:proton symporter [Pantoea phytobeneficialis]QGR09221.1 citrate transporter [Pantoea phytobeneficialis]